MEGIKVYEDSYEYLECLKKMLTTNSITIEFNKLDENSKAEICSSLRKAIYSRASRVYSTIQNSNNQSM